MIEQIKKIQWLLAALIFMGTAIAGYYFVDQLVITKGESLAMQSETIANQRVFDNQYQKLQSIVEETAVERQLLDTFILEDDADTISLLTTFDSIASQKQIKLETKRLNVEDGEQGTFNTLKLEYELTGLEPRVVEMIKMFETLPYHGEITEVAVDRRKSGRQSGVEIAATVSLALTIRDYD